MRPSHQFVANPSPSNVHPPRPQSGRTSRASGNARGPVPLPPSTAFVHANSQGPVYSAPQYANNNCLGHGYPEIGQTQYLAPYQIPNAFSPPSSAGSDVIFNTPSWSGYHLSPASDLSTPSLAFDSYSSSSSASYSPSNHGRRCSLTSNRPPSSQGPAFPYHDTAHGISRHPTRRGSITASTPYDRPGYTTTYGDEASGIRPRRRQSIATEKEKERERARARTHRENEQRVLMELSRRLPPPALSRKRSRIEVMTDATLLIDDLRNKNDRYERGHRATQSAQEFRFVHHGEYH
ncbi:uncharacterized protein STEHIDRAFT_157640 [Stereum hirsutum FP-91666 SS1]|uniref:uncharacterized protein n=1 Tax=Stereum hirsutum (strain FP-91666) TaxID=721885 RepID=UPI0004449657|nr:uncharacterized protein STEHIDRAFT_157640 [Stereum hirsutum FP-91666 SS1]EIM86131.1 hypothetical protein STEHIDRAFT_157640 [Stereum hirsutum FP-91666 SS1]